MLVSIPLRKLDSLQHLKEQGMPTPGHPATPGLPVHGGEMPGTALRGMVCRAQGQAPECQSGEARIKTRSPAADSEESSPTTCSNRSKSSDCKVGWENNTKEGCGQDDANDSFRNSHVCAFYRHGVGEEL